MTKARTLLATAVLVVLAALFGAGVIATSADAEPRSVSSNTLTGTWNVTVNRPAPLPPLKSVQVFTSGGALIEMANESQAGRTAQYGAWERIEADSTRRPRSSTASMPRGTSWAPRRSTRPSSWVMTETLSSTSRGWASTTRTTNWCRASSVGRAACGCRSSGFPTCRDSKRCRCATGNGPNRCEGGRQPALTALTTRSEPRTAERRHSGQADWRPATGCPEDD